MRVLFWGTPAYAVPSLEALLAAGHELVGVVSQPDRRRGRGAELQPSPVKAKAMELGLPTFTPARIRREPQLQAELAALKPEVSVVVAFGQILPPEVLEQPPLGCWNGHGSLLPRWRGAAPIQWALLEGDAETGVGIMAMEEGLDTGPVLLERRVAIGLLENAGQLGERLSAMTASLLVEALPRIAAAGTGCASERAVRLALRPQPVEGVTYARLLQRDDYGVTWAAPALAVHRRVMGLWPGAFTSTAGRRLKLLACEPLQPALGDQLSPEVAALLRQRPSLATTAVGQPPGTVLELLDPLGLVVACADGALLLRQAQLEGRRACEGRSLLQQLNLRPGDPLT
ncbi:MAG: methionyl-tRNA formyltransferase [Synechococcaceae cyanobacterium]|jgi:methionyl-tRNA formyltransferase